MKIIKILSYSLVVLYLFNLSSCIDEDFIIEREANEKRMLKAAQIVKAVAPTNLGIVKDISFEDCNDELRKALTYIIDVRSASSYLKNHIEGAVSIPLDKGDFKSNVSLLQKGDTYLLYGGDYNKSGKASKIMQTLGFKHMYNLRSSMDRCISVKVKLSNADNPANIKLQARFVSEKPVSSLVSGLGKINSIDVKDWAKYQTDDNILVDIRSVEEYVKGHIEGALHVDWHKPGFIKDFLNTVSSNKGVVLYGNNNGIDGDNAMSVLQAIGYPEVYNLSKGISAYKKAGLKLIPLEIKGDPLHLSEDDFAKAIVGELGVVVDVRSIGEFDIAHIPNALMIDVKKKSFKDKFSKLDKNTPVFLYCRTGVRSMKASKIAKELGYNVFNLDHGFKGWLKHHKPIVGEAHSIDNGEEGC